MPVSSRGQQLVTFASILDPDQNYSKFTTVVAKKGDTILSILGHLGRPEEGVVDTVMALNRNVVIHLKPTRKLRDPRSKLVQGSHITLPGTLAPQDHFSVLLADEARPYVKDGYADWVDVERPGRLSINRFKGYKPIEIDVPVEFEEWLTQDGASVEAAIVILERMAGRGNFSGAADGAPAVVTVSITDNSGVSLPLIGSNYQSSSANETAPSWRISKIAWAGGDLSDDHGRRIRAKAVITLRQHTSLALAKSAAQRAKSKTRSSKHTKKVHTKGKRKS